MCQKNGETRFWRICNAKGKAKHRLLPQLRRRVCPKCYAELTEASDYEHRLAEANRNLKVADAILLSVLTIATVAMVCVLFLLLTT